MYFKDARLTYRQHIHLELSSVQNMFVHNPYQFNQALHRNLKQAHRFISFSHSSQQEHIDIALQHVILKHVRYVQWPLANRAHLCSYAMNCKVTEQCMSYLIEDALLLEFCDIRDELNNQLTTEQVVWMKGTTLQ